MHLSLKLLHIFLPNNSISHNLSQRNNHEMSKDSSARWLQWLLLVLCPKFLLLIIAPGFLLGNDSVMIVYCLSRFPDLPSVDKVILLGQLGFLSRENLETEQYTEHTKSGKNRFILWSGTLSRLSLVLPPGFHVVLASTLSKPCALAFQLPHFFSAQDPQIFSLPLFPMTKES